jgi:hypothetical protein
MVIRVMARRCGGAALRRPVVALAAIFTGCVVVALNVCAVRQRFTNDALVCSSFLFTGGGGEAQPSLTSKTEPADVVRGDAVRRSSTDPPWAEARHTHTGDHTGTAQDQWRPLPAVKSVIDTAAAMLPTGPWLQTSHICSGRPFARGRGEVPTFIQNAHCVFANLCIAPGKGEPPQSKKTKGHYDWCVRHPVFEPLIDV